MAVFLSDQKWQKIATHLNLIAHYCESPLAILPPAVLQQEQHVNGGKTIMNRALPPLAHLPLKKKRKKDYHMLDIFHTSGPIQHRTCRGNMGVLHFFEKRHHYKIM